MTKFTSWKPKKKEESKPPSKCLIVIIFFNSCIDLKCECYVLLNKLKLVNCSL